MLTANGWITIGKMAAFTLSFALVGQLVQNHHPHHPNIQINEEWYDNIRKKYRKDYGETKNVTAPTKPVVAAEKPIRKSFESVEPKHDSKAELVHAYTEEQQQKVVEKSAQRYEAMAEKYVNKNK